MPGEVVLGRLDEVLVQIPVASDHEVDWPVERTIQLEVDGRQRVLSRGERSCRSAWQRARTRTHPDSQREVTAGWELGVSVGEEASGVVGPHEIGHRISVPRGSEHPPWVRNVGEVAGVRHDWQVREVTCDPSTREGTVCCSGDDCVFV
jgi:hypothetical protein